MDCVQLGRTGLRVSKLCFGTMSFGSIADEETSESMYRRCREVGINFFDCADVYSAGRAEEILGALMSEEREQLVITSKVGFPTGPGPNDWGLSRRHIFSAVERSLDRLDTDWIDLYFLHRFDPTTPIEETLLAVGQLVQEGVVHALGVSNWAAWQIADGLGLTALRNLPPIACVQPMYNLTKRQAEVEILPLALEKGLGVITYSPLGGGLLTGKYGIDDRPLTGRLVENQMYEARYGDPSYFEIAERFTALAEAEGIHPVTLAVSWVAHHPAVTAPIIGARDLTQLEPSLAADEVEMDEDLYARISALSPAPPPATDRTEERSGIAYRGREERYK